MIVTQYFQNVLGYSAIEAGLLILPFAVGFAAVAPVAGILAAKVGRRVFVVAGLATEVVAIATVGVGLSISPVLVAVALLAVSTGLGLAATPLTALAMSSVPPDRTGMASGIMSTQRALGSTTGYAVLGTVLAVWVGAHIDAELTPAIPDPRERTAAADAVVDAANPSAYAAEIGPGRPIETASAAERSEILAAADDVFVDGMQVALGVTGVVLVLVLLGAARTLPHGRSPRT